MEKSGEETASPTALADSHSAVGEVHGDFKTDPQVFVGWFGPHNAYLFVLSLSSLFENPV